MAKILIISAVFPPEPVVSAQISYDLAENLCKHHEVTVLCPKPTRPFGYSFKDERDIKFRYKVIRLSSFTCPESKIIGRIKESKSFGNHCADYISEHKNDIDIIYANAWPLFSQKTIVKTAKKYKIPCILHIQDIYPESYINKLKLGRSIIYKLLLPIDKYVLANAAHIICISENMQKILSETRRIPLKKMDVIPNWQNEEPFLPFVENTISTVNDKEHIFTFMYLGNNGPVASVDFLIKSFIKAKIPNSRLIVAGGGSKTEDCKEIVRKAGADNVFFIPVPEGKVPEIQSIADVMLLPVKKGGAMSSIPSKLPAYMFSAKPILGSLDKESDTAKAIVDANCGIVTEPENESELITAMQIISEWDKSLLEEKGQNGFNYAMKNFSKAINLKKIVELLMLQNEIQICKKN
jgi:glycosyltransferase involved in cell wall biosynthesis